MLLGKVNLGGEGSGGLPVAGCARSGLLQHLVDLLKSKSLGLRYEEEGTVSRSLAKLDTPE